jgi:hypothetical protein
MLVAGHVGSLLVTRLDILYRDRSLAEFSARAVPVVPIGCNSTVIVSTHMRTIVSHIFILERRLHVFKHAKNSDIAAQQCPSKNLGLRGLI